MEKIYIRKPFDVELAKKIQSGEIEGRIVQNNGLPATILAFDINGENLAVRFLRKDGTEGIDEHQPNGKVLAEWCSGSEEFALAIELPEEEPNPIYSKEQCVYGKDSKMKCDFCSALCKERAEDFAKRRK